MPPSTPQDRKSSTKKTASKKARRVTTGKPVVEPPKAETEGKYAVNTWGSIGGYEDLTVPSGQLCLVKRPGVQGLMAAGVLHNIDGLTAMVNQKHIKRVKGGPSSVAPGVPDPASLDMQSILKDPEALDSIMHTVDRVVCHVVIKPEVTMTPNDVTRRRDGVIYADMVDLVDKMFIFNFAVGGSRDLETFRGGLGEAVGSLDDGEGVEGPPE